MAKIDPSILARSARHAGRSTALRIVFAAAAALLLACSRATLPAPDSNDASSETSNGASAVLSAYVIFATDSEGATIARARVIVEEASPGCPSLIGTEIPISMERRNNPHGFAVAVCDAEIPLEAVLTVDWTGARLPAAGRDPQSIQVFGDTGCEPKDCATGAASPFAAIAAAAAAAAPDLVIHVGDYNYRGTGGFDYGPDQIREYDAGDDARKDPLCQLQSTYVSRNAGYSDRRDAWDDWRLDFFDPAAPLLAAAPLVVARGNHELCSRSGPGWFYFLDPSPAGKAQLHCPPQGDDATPPTAAGRFIMRPPYTLDLGSLRLAVLDTANACDGHAPPITTDVITVQLTHLFADIPADGPPTWLVAHRPFFGVWGSGAHQVTGSVALQSAFSEASSQPPPGLELILSGHMHQFLSATFAGPSLRPPQLIIGDSGVSLMTPEPTGPFDATIAGEAANVLALAYHGYLAMTMRANGAWTGKLMDPDGATVQAVCNSEKMSGSICSAQ